jgi:DNA-directed RNA polymerase specialized sigma24 family protein
MGDDDDEPRPTDDDGEAYERASRVLGTERVHDLVARRGPELLNKPIPYLVRSARNLSISEWRKHRPPSVPLDESLDNEPITHGAPWDPVARVVASDELARVIDALASMDDRDVLVVWRNVQGASDETIQREWDELGLEPREPSLAAIRKRRERARDELRRRVGE